MELKARYESLKGKAEGRQKDFSNVMNFIETETAYLTSPASTKFHLCRERGLLEHSVNVAETMLKIKSALAPDIPDESCVIVALLHDLGKAGMPRKPQYTSNAFPNAKSPYLFNSNLTYLSVPLRSLYLTLPRFPLSEEEAQAIAYHDGQYVDDNHSVAMKECALTLLLQYADTWSSLVLEKDI